AVDDARGEGARLVGPEPCTGLVETRELAELEPLEMRVPAVDLALVEALGLAEALEPARLPVDAGELCDRVDGLPGEALPRRQVGVEGRRPPVDVHARPAVDELHQVKAGAEARRVVAGGEDAGVRDIGPAERREAPVLAQHRLVPPLRYLSRRTPEHEARVAATHLEDLVRGAARDEVQLDGQNRAGEGPLVHPAGELLRIDETLGAIGIVRSRGRFRIHG